MTDQPLTSPAADDGTAPERHVQVVILGGGPGGYVAGIRAGQLGLDAVVIDAQPLGGTCLNVGCIPSKAFIHAADQFATATEQAASAPIGISVKKPRLDLAATVAWKDGIVQRLNNGVAGLLSKAGAEVITGTGRIIDGKTVVVDLAGTDHRSDQPAHLTLTCDHLVIATGSAPTALPHLPFGTGGPVPVLSSTDALALTDVPNRLAVVGGGYIGLELGIALAKLGSAVTVVEAEPALLSTYDAELTRPVSKTLSDLGVTVMTATTADALTSNGLRVSAADGTTTDVQADAVLVTVGRSPVLTGFGAEDLGLTMDGRFVHVDQQGRTSMRNVWAMTVS